MRLLLVICCLSLPALSLLAGSHVKGVNPALLHWQGIALMPEPAPDELKKLPDILTGKTPIQSRETDVISQSYARALSRLERAVGSREICLWGSTLDEEGPMAPLPYVPKLQQLIRIALLQAMAHYASGSPDDTAVGTHWAMAARQAARHLAADDLFQTIAYQQSIEAQAIQMIADHLLPMKDEQRQTLLEQERQISPTRSLKQALHRERQMLDWLRRSAVGIDITAQEEETLLQAAETQLTMAKKTLDESKIRDASQSLSALRQWKIDADRIRAILVTLEQIATQPWPESQPAMLQLEQQGPKETQAARHLISNASRCRLRDAETQTRQRMLQAALTLGPQLQPGPLPNHLDAFEGQPFIVEKKGATLQITCQSKVPTRSITLMIR